MQINSRTNHVLDQEDYDLIDVDQINSSTSIDKERNKGTDSFTLEEEMAKFNIM